MNENYVRVFDTTLRDGEQSPGASLTSYEKIEIARALALLGVDIIEAGFPAASEDDLEAVRRISEEIGNSSAGNINGEVPIICGLARTVKSDIDKAYKALKYAAKPRLHTFLATSPIHMQYKLKMDQEEVVDKAKEMVSFVMRILDPTSATLGVDKLGFEPEQKEALLKAAHSPYGMLLVTGPTGSGKTVTLYTCVNILNTAETNISTAEDPVEINLPGVNQVNVNEKVGLDFGTALRAFLRQDPDIILVGEIRDIDTASIAIKAAQTGHMVLSTLHTNSAPATLSRLVNMGVPPFNIASAVNLIVAQRLGRRLCESCKQPISIPDEALITAGFKEDELDGLTLYGPKGCSECGDSGYKGRVGIYEVMPITARIGEIIMEGGTELEIEKQMLKEGVSDLRSSALRKVRAGVTSLEEVERVTLQ